MNLPFNVNPAQAEKFMHLYVNEKQTLRVCAEECGIDIISATMLAQRSGCLRFSEAVIVNSKSGEQGRMGEDIFQAHLPAAVNCNTSIRYANPSYDFLLDGLRIDVKCSAGFLKKATNSRIFPMRVDNVLKTDLFVLLAKSQTHTANEPDSYRHCFIIPSLFLINHSKLEIREEALQNKNLAWGEYCYPIEQMAQMVQQIAQNKELFAIPADLKETAHLNKTLKKEIKRAKKQPDRNQSIA